MSEVTHLRSVLNRAVAYRVGLFLVLVTLLAMPLATGAAAGQTAITATDGTSHTPVVDPTENRATVGEPLLSAQDDGSVQSVNTTASEVTRTDTIQAEHTASLLPSQPGVIRVTYEATIPDSVADLQITVTSAHTTVRTDGFEPNADDSYDWDGRSATATIVYDIVVNTTDQFNRTTSVATEDWAFFKTNKITTGAYWSYRNVDGIDYDREFNTAGEGYVDDYIFLGPHEVTRVSQNPRVAVVVNDALRNKPNPTRVAGFTDYVKQTISLNDGPDEVTAFILGPPMDGGRAVDTSFYVGANVTSPADPVFAHEFYHVHQTAAHPTESAEWLFEGSAAYFERYTNYVTGSVDGEYFTSFTRVSNDAVSRDSVLSQPDTWTESAEYNKGSHVLAALDVQIREATDGERTVFDVLERVNTRDQITHTEFKTIVSDVAGDSLGPWVDRYVTTDDTPPLPDNLGVALGSPERNVVADVEIDSVTATAGERIRINPDNIIHSVGDDPTSEYGFITAYSGYDVPGEVWTDGDGRLVYDIPADASGQQYIPVMYSDGIGGDDGGRVEVNVQPPDDEVSAPIADRFDDGDNEIDAKEVLQVISAYNTGDADISASKVLQVISAYNRDASWSVLSS